MFYSKKAYIGFILIGVIISLISFEIFQTKYIYEGENIINTELNTNAYVETVENKEYNQSAVLRIENINGYFIAKLDKYPAVYSGDVINIKGKISKPKNISKDFDYESYLKSKKIFYEFNGEFEIISENEDIFKNTKLFLEASINKDLDFKESSLLTGILFGGNSAFSEQFKENLSNSGLYHIVSVSGFNFTILYAAIISLSGIINRKILYFLSIPVIVSYLLLVGVNNIPAQRATVMIIIVITSLIIGKKIAIINLLLFSVVLILLEYPLYSTNISFLLSFGAVIGLFALGNSIKESLESKAKRIPKVFIEIVSSTLAVMILTSVLTVIVFESFSVVSILSNILVLPLIPFVMYFGFIYILTVLSNIEILMYLTTSIIQVLLKAIIFIIELFGKIDSKNSYSILIGIIIIFSTIIFLINNDFKEFKEKTK